MGGGGRGIKLFKGGEVKRMCSFMIDLPLDILNLFLVDAENETMLYHNINITKCQKMNKEGNLQV